MPSRARAFAATFGLAIAGSLPLVAGCAGVPTGLGAGEPCVRSAQCEPSLVCSMGMCTADLTGLGGMPPVRPMDGGPIDAQVDPDAEVDAGIDLDAGMEDAGVELDSGMEVDAFVPMEDAFVPMEDAFVPMEDAFVPMEDASVPDEDAGI